jgi:hypothetical protein
MKTVAINFIILLVGFILIELIFGGWFSEQNKINNLGILTNINLHYPLNELYVDSASSITYTRDKYGLRGNSSFNHPEKIDILTIGGSTTDQRYINDGRTWQDVLENEFKKIDKNVIVSNAGMDGQSTFGHIKNFELWFPYVPGLKPKYIIFYIGINDFHLIADNSKYDELSINNSIWSSIKNNSAIINLYRKIRGAITAKRLRIDNNKVDFKGLKYIDKPIADSRFLELYKKNNLVLFKNRLIKLIELTKNLGAEPIFVTQPSIGYKFNEGKLVGVENLGSNTGYLYNGVDYYILITELNKVIKEVVNNRYTIIELTSLSIWNESDFYDFYHNTPSGANKIGKEIFKYVNNKIE